MPDGAWRIASLRLAPADFLPSVPSALPDQPRIEPGGVGQFGGQRQFAKESPRFVQVPGDDPRGPGECIGPDSARAARERMEQRREPSRVVCRFRRHVAHVLKLAAVA